MRNHFGSNIMFREAIQGTRRGQSYKWIGSARKDMPYVIFFNKHRCWETKDEKKIIRKTIRVINHEPIHQILWKYKLDLNTTYDVIKYRFLKQFGKKLKSELRTVL